MNYNSTTKLNIYNTRKYCNIKKNWKEHVLQDGGRKNAKGNLEFG